MNKEELRRIINDDYNLPDGKTEFGAIQDIIGILGSTDAELRDNLGYGVLNQWLLKKNFLNDEQLEILLDKALSEDMLFYNIGESGTDSVFLRSFSSLLIALILIRDNSNKFLNREKYEQMIEKIGSYCDLENDYRGYIEGKGWAHAPAHIADVIDECMKNSYTALNECSKLWNALLVLTEGASEVFKAEEDERISLAAVTMIELKKVQLPVFIEWLDKKEELIGRDITSKKRRINFKHLIRCLYFRLSEKELLGEMKKEFLSLEKNLIHTINTKITKIKPKSAFTFGLISILLYKTYPQYPGCNRPVLFCRLMDQLIFLQSKYSLKGLWSRFFYSAYRNKAKIKSQERLIRERRALAIRLKYSSSSLFFSNNGSSISDDLTHVVAHFTRVKTHHNDCVSTHFRCVFHHAVNRLFTSIF
jgi:hypothetical protein